MVGYATKTARAGRNHDVTPERLRKIKAALRRLPRGSRVDRDGNVVEMGTGAPRARAYEPKARQAAKNKAAAIAGIAKAEALLSRMKPQGGNIRERIEQVRRDATAHLRFEDE